jgi:predicted heme/steroid binding protein
MNKPRVFTKQELSQYNGKNGAPAYIACGGKVYDVSASYFWRNGRHQVVNAAGADLTSELQQAPHGAEMLERVPVVGILSDD